MYVLFKNKVLLIIQLIIIIILNEILFVCKFTTYLFTLFIIYYLNVYYIFHEFLFLIRDIENRRKKVNYLYTVFALFFLM